MRTLDNRITMQQCKQTNLTYIQLHYLQNNDGEYKAKQRKMKVLRKVSQRSQRKEEGEVIRNTDKLQ